MSAIFSFITLTRDRVKSHFELKSVEKKSNMYGKDYEILQKIHANHKRIKLQPRKNRKNCLYAIDQPHFELKI